jgi:hypothetical protein
VPPAIRGLCSAAVRGSRVRGHTDVGNNIRFGRVRLWVGLCMGGEGSGVSQRVFVWCLVVVAERRGAVWLWNRGSGPPSLFMLPSRFVFPLVRRHQNFVPNRTWPTAEGCWTGSGRTSPQQSVALSAFKRYGSWLCAG